MLEKHLVQLKMMPAPVEQAPAGGVSMTSQSPATQSVKDESSPSQSPAAPMNGWQPPTQFQGMAAAAAVQPTVQPQYVAAAPVAATAYVDQNGMPYSANQAALNMASARPQNRRQVSDMAGAADGNAATKRQRIYNPQQPQMMINPVQARPG